MYGYVHRDKIHPHILYEQDRVRVEGHIDQKKSIKIFCQVPDKTMLLSLYSIAY